MPRCALPLATGVTEVVVTSGGVTFLRLWSRRGLSREGRGPPSGPSMGGQAGPRARVHREGHVSSPWGVACEVAWLLPLLTCPRGWMGSAPRPEK